MGKLLTLAKENFTTETVCLGGVLLMMFMAGVLGVIMGIRDGQVGMVLFGLLFASFPITAVLDAGKGAEGDY